MAKFAWYCTCGASWVGTAYQPGAVAGLLAEWLSLHQGPGHTPCDAQTASRARAKAEEDYFAETEAAR